MKSHINLEEVQKTLIKKKKKILFLYISLIYEPHVKIQFNLAEVQKEAYLRKKEYIIFIYKPHI